MEPGVLVNFHGKGGGMDVLERSLVEKAARDHGWENILDSRPDGVDLGSARHRGRMTVTGHPPDGWMVRVPSDLVLRELARSLDRRPMEDGAFPAPDMDALARLLRRAAELFVSLPRQAERTYEARLADILMRSPPDRTEAERLVRRRVGQETFREALLDYWGGACAVTGIDLPDILRASHAKPWADCATDAERLDVFNGFLLRADLDALFDRGLVTFDRTGRLTPSPRLSPRHRSALGLDRSLALRWLAPEHEVYLSWHREKVFRHGPTGE